MIVTMRPYNREADQRRVVALVRAFPDEQLHVADLPYRLASWALESDRNARVWIDQTGELLAFAIIQVPWQTLDYFVRPGAAELGVETPMLVWATERMHEIAAERRAPATLFVSMRESQLGRAVTLGQHGFAPVEWSIVYHSRRLLDVVPEPQVPIGYTLRHVAGEAEAEALVRLQRAAFASNTMTAAWRRRAMDAPEYVPELDIVAEEPGGQLAGFCWCWLSPGTHRSQIEPIGVHPQHARPGLARAMLLESLWRLQAHGAHEVCAAAYEDDEAAARLYQGAGFHLDFRTTAYARTFD